MSSTKFTPGPWACENRSGSGWVICGNPGIHNFVESYTTGDGPVHIFNLPNTSASVPIAHARWVQFKPTEWEDMQAANAHLIAAAPELYAALEAAIECGMVPKSSVADGGAAKYARQVEVADQIRSALKKARGE